MFNNNNDTVSSNVSHIGEGLQVEGDLICKGTIEISGIMNGNIKAYNIAIRENNELEQGVGKWYFNYASKDINAIINSECFYSIRYYNYFF